MEGRLEIVLPEALNTLEVDRILGDLASPARVIVLRGGSDVFCRGLSLELAANDPDAAVRCVQRLGNLVLALGKASAPVVALVEGEALGGGAALAAAADLVIASPSASFALPEVLSGLIPAVALPTIAARTGIAAARLMGLTARSLSAEEAQHAGLVDEVVDDPDRRLLEWEKRWRLLDPGALKALKRLAHELGGLEGQLREASVRFEQQLRQPETRARLKKWLEGDAPWG